MTLRFYDHPLASFCHKVLVALYESGTPLESVIVDLGDDHSVADCSAAPALLYSELVEPFGEARHVADYFARLAARPSVAQVLREAEPYFSNFPLDRKPRIPQSHGAAAV